MKKLAFVVPVHGRLPLAKICLRQLRRTCDALIEREVKASAVVVSDRDTLRELDPLSLDFGMVCRDNRFLSRRFNDGIQLATDPRYSSEPADYVVPCGSDDWVDYRIFLEPLPDADTLQGFQTMSFVREDGREIAAIRLNYEGGAGIRIIPRELVAPLGYRPADEDRERGCDTSILRNLRCHHGDSMRVAHMHLHARQIVDWKTPNANLNTFQGLITAGSFEIDEDPFSVLADYYPVEALDEMRDYYEALRS